MRFSSICICRRSLEVERPERLVEEEDVGTVDERARQRDALLRHQRAWPGFFRPTSPSLDEVEGLRLGHRVLVTTAFEAEGDVVEHGHVREQRVRLEHGVDVALVRLRAGDVLVPMRIRPAVGSSRPAIIRRVVVFPHPEGLSAKKDPWGICRSRTDSREGVEGLAEPDETQVAGGCRAISPW